MTDKRSLEEIERLVQGLGKDARKGTTRPKKETQSGFQRLRQTLSRFFESEATRKVKELEVDALERKHRKEALKAMELRRRSGKEAAAHQRVEEIVDKYLKK
ncbi:MAG: hypothetical protein JXL84_06880 [Deltaproteobacteria bacterium]|nr:hypothetical protein [Deltaproteobacteria bacterium]